MQLYEQLQRSTDNGPEKIVYIAICGDLNARLGRSNKQENEWHGILRNFGTGMKMACYYWNFAPLDEPAMQ